MSISMTDILNIKFPNVDFTKDIIIQDDSDGKGPYIAKWNLSGPVPSQADLDQWAIDLAPQYQFEQNKITNTPIYKQLDDIDKKSTRALRENDQARLTDLENQAAALRSQLLPVK